MRLAWRKCIVAVRPWEDRDGAPYFGPLMDQYLRLIPPVAKDQPQLRIRILDSVLFVVSVCIRAEEAGGT